MGLSNALIGLLALVAYLIIVGLLIWVVAR
jgi:hypothetical protein